MALTPDQQAAVDAVCNPAGVHATHLKAMLAKEAAVRHLAPGDLLFAHGDEAHAAYLVVDGSVEEWRDEAPVALRKDDEFVGELALLHPGSRRRTEARARQDTELLEIPAAMYQAAAHGPGGGTLTSAAGLHASGLLKGLTQAFLRLRLASLPERHNPDPSLNWSLDRALLTPVTLPDWASELYPENVWPHAPGTWATDGQGWLLHLREAGTLRSSFTMLLAPVRTEAPANLTEGLLVLACWSDDFLGHTWLREVLGWPAMYGRVELGSMSVLGGGYRRVVFRTEGGEAWTLRGRHKAFGSPWATTALQTILPHPALGTLPAAASTSQVHAALSALPPVRLLWRRSFFRPGRTAGAGPSWAWKAEDFTADELVSMQLQLTPDASPLGLLELAGPGLDIHRPWVADETVPGGASLRLAGSLVSSSVKVELDYRATFANQAPPAKLAWGPGVWLPPGYVAADRLRPRPVDRRRPRVREPHIELLGLNTGQQAIAKALSFEPALERMSTEMLERVALALLPGASPATELAKGDLLFQKGDAPGTAAWLVLDGKVSLWLGDVLVEERQRGQLVGCEAILQATHHGLTARASRPSTMLQPIDWNEIKTAMSLSEPFRHWVETQPLSALNQAEELAAVQEGASGSLFVGPQGKLLPGPYTATDVEMVTLLVGPPDQPLPLPPGVSGGPLHEPGEWMLMLTRFERFKHPGVPSGEVTYTEVALTRRVWVKGKPYRWFAVVKPDNLMAFSTGREIYGYPKLWDRAQFTDDRIRLRRSNGALDVAWREGHDGPLFNQMVNPLLGEGGHIVQLMNALPGLETLSKVPFLARRRVPKLKGGPWSSWDAADWHQDALCLTWMTLDELDDVQFLVRRDKEQTQIELPLDGGTLLKMKWDGTLWRSRSKMSLLPSDEVVFDYLTEPLSAADKQDLKDW